MRDTFRVEVFWQSGADGRVADLLSQLAHLNTGHVSNLHISNLFFLRGNLSAHDIETLAQALLADPVVEAYTWRAISDHTVTGPAVESEPTSHVIEVSFHPGVTDPVARHLLQRAHLLGVSALAAATTGTRYVLEGDLTPDDLHHIASELLCNKVIQSYTLNEIAPVFVPEAAPNSAVETVPICDLDDAALARLSVDRVLFLSLPEMRAIRDEFRGLGRDPTDVELETLAQTWSEHCLHKTFKSPIMYHHNGGMERITPGTINEFASGSVETISSLIKTYLQAATDRLAKPWVRSAFVDNAGIIDFDETYEVSFKVETHNHPSALEPFGGANTGVGGVIRDVMGVSARPIANTDILCFAPLDIPGERIPGGTLHPRRIARGVIDGIEDYGNKMGIPTVNGAILYDDDYVANPLVYCGCVGIAPKNSHPRAARPGDRVVVLGGRTGRDGLHGATFSSTALTHETGAKVGSVVQIGDPITEKATLEAIIQARDERLYTAITDCGAGGLSSAVGEMGERVGVDVDLQNVPLKYPGLRPWEIWLSEAQERMVLAVPDANLARLGKICRTYDVEWTVIGRFTGDGRLHVRYNNSIAADLSMAFLHQGWPRNTRDAVWTPPESPPDPQEPVQVAPSEMQDLLCRALAHPDVASKERVIRRYDHEVQGATVGKPLVGVAADGPADAAVLKPLVTGGQRGLALGCGINPHYGRIDPYAMAWAVIDEALRNVVCVGADPDRVAILDNFCWGNPALPDRLGALVRATQGCHDAALAYEIPFISGKDSLNNEFVDARGEKRTIPPTLLISSIGIVPDIRLAPTMALKAAGNAIYLIGATRAELGGSLYDRLQQRRSPAPPAPVSGALTTMRALHHAIIGGTVCAVHDLSEGGLVVAAAEMCIAGRMGLMLSLAGMARAGDVKDDVTALFAESSARFLVEVTPQAVPTFEALLKDTPCARIGVVQSQRWLQIQGLAGETVLATPVDELVRVWQSAEVV